MALFMADNRTDARRLQRLARQGKLRRIYEGIYTDDLMQPLETLTRRELLGLCAALAKGCIISDRSALESQRFTLGGVVYLTGSYRRTIKLPGTELRIAQGPGPLDSDIRIPTFAGDTHVSSQARALLENLKTSRGNPAERRTLGPAGVEQWLDRFIGRDVTGAINRIRDSAREIATPLGLEAEFKELDAKIAALLGTRKATLSTAQALARAARRPYDPERLELFEALAKELHQNPLQIAPADPAADFHLQAFVETYFSNFIEGTEFELETAHRIVVRGEPVQYREDDSHDILGTYKAILRSKQQSELPKDAEQFLQLLQEWNSQVIESRRDKHPGEFKTEPNRAGSTLFVSPDMTVGTLIKGFESIMSGATAENRAALAMYVVSEVHPFADGNGRTARIAMNHFLSNAALTRIIIPTVYREDYISALKAMSSNAHSVPYGRMLSRAGRFSRWLDMSSKDRCFAALERSNALKHHDEAHLRFDEASSADQAEDGPAPVR